MPEIQPMQEISLADTAQVRGYSSRTRTRTGLIRCLARIWRMVVSSSPHQIPLSPRTRRSAYIDFSDVRRIYELNTAVIRAHSYKDSFKLKSGQTGKTICLSLAINCTIDCLVKVTDHKGEGLITPMSVIAGQMMEKSLDVECIGGKPTKILIALISSSSLDDDDRNIMMIHSTAMTIQSNKTGPHLKVLSQYIDYNGRRFLLQDVFDQPARSVSSHNLRESQDCVVCLNEERDTIALPCRHMCVCSACAYALSDNNGACPLCRQQLSGLIVTKSRILEKNVMVET